MGVWFYRMLHQFLNRILITIQRIMHFMPQEITPICLIYDTTADSEAVFSGLSRKARNFSSLLPRKAMRKAMEMTTIEIGAEMDQKNP
jgi:hypothetical protein